MAIIPYANVVNVERLPVDAQDIVTKVRLVIAGNRAGAEPGFLWVRGTTAATDPAAVTYTPWPITHVYEAPEHATYGAERSLALPEGFNPFLPPTDASIPEPDQITHFSNPGTPSAIRDGDPDTYAEWITPGVSTDIGGIMYPFVEDCYGFLLRYSLGSQPSVFDNVLKTSAVVRVQPLFDGDPPVLRYGFVEAATGEQLPDTGDPRELYMVIPPIANIAPENEPPHAATRFQGRVSMEAFDGTQFMQLYAFYPLVLNRALLEEVAKANVRLPALIPRRVTVDGYVAPDREHTITGWPGGDFTGSVAQHQYELGRTVIDFEQAGAPTGLPAEAVEAARERTVAVKSEIQRSGYSVKMGERQ